jgi:hypothetical protein
MKRAERTQWFVRDMDCTIILLLFVDKCCFWLSLCKIVRNSVICDYPYLLNISKTCWFMRNKVPYPYTFSLSENPSLIIFSAETEYISTRSWYRNINFLRFDIYFTEFGTALTTILPALFKYCCKYCYSDSRNLWAVMKAGGLAL